MRSQWKKLLSASTLVAAGLAAGLLVAGGTGITTPASAERPAAETVASFTNAGPDFAALAERVVPSVVSVYSTDVIEPDERGRRRPSDPFEFFFGPQFGPRQPREREPRVRQGSGSGFFITSGGELLTNNHVIENADRIEIELDDGSRYRVSVVGRDPATDIAVLRVDEPDRQFPTLAMGDSEDATFSAETFIPIAHAVTSRLERSGQALPTP